MAATMKHQVALLLAVALTPFLALCAPSSILADLLHETSSPGSVAFMTYCRRQLHQIPEQMYEEYKTSEFIRMQLDDLGIPYVWPVALTGAFCQQYEACIQASLPSSLDTLYLQWIADSDQQNSRCMCCLQCRHRRTDRQRQQPRHGTAC